MRLISGEVCILKKGIWGQNRGSIIFTSLLFRNHIMTAYAIILVLRSAKSYQTGALGEKYIQMGTKKEKKWGATALVFVLVT